MPEAAIPTEDAPLLGENSNNTQSLDTMANETGSMASSDQNSQTGTSQRLWEELDQPWPSTFERGISLLASPVIPKEEVVLFTKSPKPGSTPTALARRANLNRGYYTPDHGVLLPQTRRTLLQQQQEAHGMTDSERMELRHHQQQGGGMVKVQSLDFTGTSSTRTNKLSSAAMAQKQESAKQYRAKILAQQQQQQETKQQQTKQPPRVDAHGQPITDEKSTVAQSAFNLANILMGVGILSLPYSFKVSGIGGGIFCLVVFGFFAWRTTLLIGQELNGDPRPSSYFDESPFKSPVPPGSSAAKARMLPPITSFPDIARTSFGSAGCLVLSTILYFELFSCICIFFVTMGDHLHQLFPAVSVETHMMIVAALSLIPAILLRTPTLLSYLSVVGTVSTVCVCLSVVVSALVAGDMTEALAAKKGLIHDDATTTATTSQQPYHIWWDTSGIPMALGLVAYCFSGHAIVPSIYTSMKEPQHFDSMVTVTFIGVVICCSAVGVMGYYMFGSLVEDQVTLSMDEVIKAQIVTRSLVWLMVLTAFSKTTLTMFPLALGMEEMIAPYLTSDGAMEAASAVVKVVLTILALIVSIYVPSFSYICALVGMICTMSVSIIFPAMAHLKMFGPRLSMWEKFLDWVFVLVGLFLAVAGTIATI